MNNDYGNLELHNIFLKAMIDFDALCKKYNFKYCLHGGTCLGAIRHKGFIPWDDDVDIAMPRKDYEKFLKISQKEFGDKYTVQTYKNEFNMVTNVTKIRINNSDYCLNEKYSNNKPFLDIFPMTAVPNSKIGQHIQNKLSIFINNIISTKQGQIIPTSLKSKIILGTLSKFNRVFLGNCLEVIIKYFPRIKPKYVNIVATAAYCNNTGYATDLWPKEYFEQIELVDFCEQKFPVTKYWHEYLTKMYGDYMTPPSIDNRQNKHGVLKEN